MDPAANQAAGNRPIGGTRARCGPVCGLARDAAAAGNRAVRESCELRREQRQYVVLGGACAGLVFDEDGTAADLSPLATMPSLPAGLAYRDGQVWVERDALRHAPKLEGTLAVFFAGWLDSYARWLTGAMPALDMLTRAMPAKPGCFCRPDWARVPVSITAR